MPEFLNFDFGYTDIEGELARNQCIENTASAQLAQLWEELIHEVYRALPGLGKENRSSDVYWLSNHRHTPIRAYLSPTRSFYPFIGLVGPIDQGWRQERCWSLDIWLLPQHPTLRSEAEIVVQIEITRKRPVHAFLKMWRKNREEIKRLILMSGATWELGAEDRPQASEALDEYRLDSSRRHRLVIAWTRGQPIDRNVVSRAFISLGRIYHVLQGVIRGDSGRVSLLAGRHPD